MEERGMRRTRLLGVLLVGGLALVACGKSSSTSSGKYATTSAPSTTVATRGATAAGGVTVSVASGAIGAHLVGADGHTLYLFEKDTGTTSACTSAGCVATWPAVVATGAPSGASGVDASKLSTATGQKPNQVVYNGHLLYEYGGDHAPGDTNGTKVPSWYAVTPAGASLENAG